MPHVEYIVEICSFDEYDTYIRVYSRYFLNILWYYLNILWYYLNIVKNQYIQAPE